MFSDSDMRRCKECNKLFRAISTETRCHECRGEEVPSASLDAKLDATVEALAFDIAQLTGIHQSVLIENLQGGMPPHEDLSPEDTCEHCSRKRKLANSDLCLNCRLELLHDVNGAAKAVHKDLLKHQVKQNTIASLRQTLEEKRARTATSHINLVAAKKLKKY